MRRTDVTTAEESSVYMYSSGIIDFVTVIIILIIIYEDTSVFLT